MLKLTNYHIWFCLHSFWYQGCRIGDEGGSGFVSIQHLTYRAFFVQYDHIFHHLNIPQNSPDLNLPRIFTIYCHPEFPPLGGAIITERVFVLITPIYFITHSKTLYPRDHLIELNLVIQAHTHFHLPYLFFAQNQTVADILFRTPRSFYQFAPNFAHSICGPS